MSNINVQQHKFIVKAGMTIDDVKNSKEATAMQKKYASAFDTDGQKGFSQKEADLFNSTTFSEKADGTVTFWTRQKDGTKKGTKFNSNDNNIQFKSDDEVKPYVKKVAVKKAAPKQNESVSFFDEAWSGHQIAKLTGDNVVTDWLQNKDKVCTDGKDDGKIGFWEGTKSFVKGLVGGIPKAMINHPVATVVAVAAGAGAIALTGGAILPVLGAVGVATGVGMAGYGGYKAVTAKTDAEAKQALETMGMGVITTALSVASADKALEKAAEAGVKSAQVSEDAGILDKTVQMFKAIPEALTKSKEWTMSYIQGTPVNIELADGTKQVKVKGKLIEETFENGSYKKYDANGNLVKEKLADGTLREYMTKYQDEGVNIKGNFTKTTYKDGNYQVIDNNTGRVLEGKFADGRTITCYRDGCTIEHFADGSYRTINKNGVTVYEEFSNADFKRYNSDGVLIKSKLDNVTSIYEDGKLVSKIEELPNGVYKTYDANNVLIETKIEKGNVCSYYRDGKLIEEVRHTTKDSGRPTPIEARGMVVGYERESIPSINTRKYYENGQIKYESVSDDYFVREYYENGNLKYLSDGHKVVRFDEKGNSTQNFPFDVNRLKESLDYVMKTLW